jgi:hypothetical protein
MYCINPRRRRRRRRHRSLPSSIVCLAVWIVSSPQMNDTRFFFRMRRCAILRQKLRDLGCGSHSRMIVGRHYSLPHPRSATHGGAKRHRRQTSERRFATVICSLHERSVDHEMTSSSFVLLERDSNCDEMTIEHMIEGSSYSAIG